MEFEKLQTASLKELFISSVEDKILSGELPIGAQLPTERELAEMMDVSRGVVNSGIAEMAHKGFLEVRPRVGTFVADYRRVGKSDIFLSIMHYNGGILPEQEIRSLLEFKILIDCFSVRKLTARAITEAEVQKLEDFVDQMAETDDPQRVSELAYAYFYRKLICRLHKFNLAVRTPFYRHLLGFVYKINFTMKRRIIARYSL